MNDQVERRQGMGEVLDRVTVLETRFNAHADQEEKDRAEDKELHKELVSAVRANQDAVNALDAKLDKQKTFLAGWMSALGTLAGVIIWLGNKAFGGH